LTINRSFESALSEPTSPVYDTVLDNDDIIIENENIPRILMTSTQPFRFGEIPNNGRSPYPRANPDASMYSVFSPSSSPGRSPSFPQENPLLKESYEALMKQIYNLPIELPPFIVVNGITMPFINVYQAGQLLGTGQIERFALDPILQPFADHPFRSNRIISLFAKNGTTYLVKASYDPITNKIDYPVN
jgi:hypothetical protein